ncbi:MULTISPECIES: transporter substrate-binding domain-containing protein [unclassified Herbaspirillum]|uniref:transporter substrate-binding domain-containing protein n=1 Tax=unclassified Herbaspirillum TaxID=2624150 RepID=UPI00114DF655|nr:MULTISPECIES: transporter substrate-binding domain-containing protein [unclassified Herbaspirillum]MBB5391882.1 polar amino acid transport system substrate-binding protein [Herbaspirillum sp. SJZ102]TQK13342.1 polar amino acid transport system substrate-binding protein [Herbaspirillum sp. SJZ130]TQK15346.1 polar amino acid transport system substrate-binding protein [Herbaspirillum sp. SJZ106]
MQPARLLFPLLLLLCGSVQAGVLDAAKQAGILRVGLDYVPPAYKGGMKFRTPESVDSVLADDLAVQFKLTSAYLKNASGIRADVALTLAPEGEAGDADTVIIPTGYRAGGMAIMRTDTSIRKWDDLKGRSVCVSEGSSYVGTLASRYGAIEKVMRAPADSLLAVRTGQCDAAVHDDSLMKELLKLPEWKKFSARLAPASRQALVLKVRGADAADLAAFRQAAGRWNEAFWAGVRKKWANNVAFEVYLDQNVPDCH